MNPPNATPIRPAGKVSLAWTLSAGLALLTAALVPTSGYSTEVAQWERLPVAVSLHVGQERILFLDRPMRVAVPSTILNFLRVQSADGAIYLRAAQAFEATRVELQDAATGALVLLDITATQAPDEDKLEPLRIVLTKSPEGERERQSPREFANTSGTGHSTGAPTPLPVLLTRYAAQNLYAPLRTVEPITGISPTPVRAELDLATLLPTLPVTITALAAWRLQDHWVTALRITNMTAKWQTLDPRALQGDFVSATFQHQRLGPQGDSTDTTVLYLVTRGHGLSESLLPSMSAVDAARSLSAPNPTGPAHEK